MMIARFFQILTLVLCCLLGACTDSPFAPDKPVSLTMWHVYGSQTDSPMNRLVEQFNKTEGREHGITINVTSVSNSTDIHFPLVAAAKGVPGAGELPDIFVSYPKTALSIGTDKLLDWRDVMSETELAEYVPSFLQEGLLNDRLVIFPLSKSTSALFINATIFDAFSRDTGISYDDLATWEGMFKAAEAYYQWSGGKAFFKYDDWLHYSMINTAAYGESLFVGKRINFNNSHFEKLWKKLARAAISGHVCLLNGYSTTAMMTGEAVCGVESTASILYFKDTVTFPDNSKMPLRLAIRPVPYFKDAEALAIQRGTGLMAPKSTPEKEEACKIFVRWLTAVENNVPFVTNAGYIPVKNEAYRNFRTNARIPEDNDKAVELYRSIEKIYDCYRFYVPPYFDGYGEVEKEFSENQTELFRKYRKIWDQKTPVEPLLDIMYSKLARSME